MGKARTSEEGLYLHTVDTTGVLVTEDETTNIDHTLTINEQLHLAIGLTRVVQTHTLADCCPSASLPCERTTSDRRTVVRVAHGFGRNVAHDIIGGVCGREVGVDLSRTIGTPHQTDGPAVANFVATRASLGNIGIITAV